MEIDYILVDEISDYSSTLTTTTDIIPKVGDKVRISSFNMGWGLLEKADLGIFQDNDAECILFEVKEVTRVISVVSPNNLDVESYTRYEVKMNILNLEC